MTPVATLGFATHQAFDHAAFRAPLVKGSLAVTAESAGHWVAYAAQLALKEPRGPVHLDLPADLASQPAVPFAATATAAPLPQPAAAELDGAAATARRGCAPLPRRCPRPS